MQRPLQITFHGIDHSDAIERRVREKVEEFERFTSEIIGCHVTIDAMHHHHHQGNLYAVRIDLRLPDQEIAVGRERRHHHAHEDVYVALRDSFDAAVRLLEDYARRRRGDVKEHEAPTLGRVVQIEPNRGFGFVQTGEEDQVYFHRNSVVGGNFDALEIGDEVRLAIAEGEGEKGPQASTVVLTRKHRV